ncbi:MAG: hypothetical protein ACREKJ_07825, partial [Candidatus Rokuibacteriota bacterium]
MFTIIGVWPFLRAEPARGWGLVVAAIFLTLALVRPRTLAPLNRLWLRLGLVLHACISPVILGL